MQVRSIWGARFFDSKTVQNSMVRTKNVRPGHRFSFNSLI